MILLVGNNKDDLLYFETRLNNKREEYVFNKYRLVIGTIATQSVILLTDIYTNILSAALLSHLIEKYYVLLVIKLGKCLTLSDRIKTGDIVVSRKIIASDVDVCDLKGTELGQVPSLPTSYDITSDLINIFSASFSSVCHKPLIPVTFISGNTHYTNEKQLNEFIHDEKVFNEPIDGSVFDSESYGIALTSKLHDIHFISINVVISKIGEKFNTNNYIKVLKQYVNVGKSVVNAISDIGSNEVTRS